MKRAAPAARIEARLRLLEIEAQVQRTALAAGLQQWERHQPLAWLTSAARVTGQALAAPGVRWLLVGAALRLIRRRRRARPG